MADEDIVRSPPLPTSHYPARAVVYLRFALSFRDVEDLLAERGLDVSYETVR
jgi:putative transposase